MTLFFELERGRIKDSIQGVVSWFLVYFCLIMVFKICIHIHKSMIYDKKCQAIFKYNYKRLYQLNNIKVLKLKIYSISVV